MAGKGRRGILVFGRGGFYNSLNACFDTMDPGAFTKPHSFQRIFNLMQNTDLLEYVCNEFNIDKDHLVGK